MNGFPFGAKTVDYTYTKVPILITSLPVARLLLMLRRTARLAALSAAARVYVSISPSV